MGSYVAFSLIIGTYLKVQVVRGIILAKMEMEAFLFGNCAAALSLSSVVVVISIICGDFLGPLFTSRGCVYVYVKGSNTDTAPASGE